MECEETKKLIKRQKAKAKFKTTFVLHKIVRKPNFCKPSK